MNEQKKRMDYLINAFIYVAILDFVIFFMHLYSGFIIMNAMDFYIFILESIINLLNHELINSCSYLHNYFGIYYIYRTILYSLYRHKLNGFCVDFHIIIYV